MKRSFFWLVLLGMSYNINGLSAQEDKYRARQGNKAFASQDLKKAEARYRKALELNGGRAEARYGLARALQSQDKVEEAMPEYQALLDSLSQTLAGERGEHSMRQMADIWHNVGNIAMKAKDYDKAIEAYEQAMILDPSDDETRYNLVLAQKLRKKDDKKDDNKQDQKQQQNQQQQQQKEQEQNKDQSPQNNPNNQDKEEQGQEQQAQSRAQAEKTLDAYKQEDERTRQKAEMALRNRKNKEKESTNRKRW